MDEQEQGRLDRIARKAAKLRATAEAERTRDAAGELGDAAEDALGLLLENQLAVMQGLASLTGPGPQLARLAAQCGRTQRALTQLSEEEKGSSPG